MIGKQVGETKVYFVGASVYLNILNFIMLLLASNKLYDMGVSALIVTPIGFFLVLLLGFIDYKFVLKHQLAHVNRQNNLKMQLNRVEDKVVAICQRLEIEGDTDGKGKVS